jgi:hypothetical protein
MPKMNRYDLQLRKSPQLLKSPQVSMLKSTITPRPLILGMPLGVGLYKTHKALLKSF